MSKKPMTNVALVKRLMEFSPQGALMQAFVIEALAHYAESALQQGTWHGASFISQDAWKACAAEVKATIEGRNA